jgi:hypothetical protein
MGVRFLQISGKDRQIIAKEILQQLQSGEVRIDLGKLETLQTLIVDPNETGTEVG